MEEINVLSLSYGKDSLACFGACEKLGIKINRAIHAEVWATDTIPADLPPMVDFKSRADEIIKNRWGIVVEHICATKATDGGGYVNLPTSEDCIPCLKKESTQARSKASQTQSAAGAKSSNMITSVLTYEDIFYRARIPRNGGSCKMYGFPMQIGQWCNSMLKMAALRKAQRLNF